jgi:hypothetical protein
MIAAPSITPSRRAWKPPCGGLEVCHERNE